MEASELSQLSFAPYLRELQELGLGHEAVRTDRHKTPILRSDLRLRQAGSVKQTGHLKQTPSVNVKFQSDSLITILFSCCSSGVGVITTSTIS